MWAGGQVVKWSGEVVTRWGWENFFMISASWRNASGDIVLGFSVFTATSTLPCQVPW